MLNSFLLEEGVGMMFVKISLLLARALWKCPTPRAMTACRGKGQLGQSGRSVGERDCETLDLSLRDKTLSENNFLHGSGVGW